VSELLTQEEIDSLLSAVSRGNLPQAPEPGRRPRHYQSVQAYDFRRKSRISKDQIRTLQMMHQTFARTVSSSLSTHLRNLVEVKLSSVEQFTYNEFILSLASPSTLGIFEMPPLKGGALFDINPHLVFPVIDRILGGSGRASIQVRELTDIERTLVDRVFRRLLTDLQQAWQQVGRFDMRLLSVETYPQFVQLTAPNDTTVLVIFDVRVGDVEGLMSLCLPFPLLEPILPKLVTQRWLGSSAAAEANGVSSAMAAHLQTMALDVRAVLEPLRVPIGRLTRLAPGDILPLSSRLFVGGPPAGRKGLAATIEVQGLPRFVGLAGQRQRRRAIEITARLDTGGNHHG